MENALVELRHYEVELTGDVSSRFGSRFLSRKEAGQELRERLLLLLTSLVGCLLMTAPCQAQWRPHTIQLVNGSENRIVLPARFQIVNETWIPVSAMTKDTFGAENRWPYLVYMPEKKRLLMLLSLGHPGGAPWALIISSNDLGATWSFLRRPTRGPGVTRGGFGLTYLGNGRLFFDVHHSMEPEEGNQKITFSHDYGRTWSRPVVKPLAPGGGMWINWDQYLVDKDPETGKTTRIWGTGGNGKGTYKPFLWFTHGTQALLRSSMDGGRTWSTGRFIPEWRGAHETAIARAKNGDMVVTCRPDPLRKFYQGVKLPNIDHYCGFGVSISKDNGHTWSRYTDNMIYGWGRHHSSMVVMPNGDIVMTHVVRVGYPDTPDGFPQFGIEAIVSHDNGKTWDLDHKYILALWKGQISTKESRGWFTSPSPKSTCSVLLPDGTILTAFGTGHRIQKRRETYARGDVFPRDIGLVQWRISDRQLNSDTTIAEAPFDSERRNTFDPNPNNLSARYLSAGKFERP